MKKSEFIKLIQSVVRKEIKKYVAIEVKKHINEIFINDTTNTSVSSLVDTSIKETPVVSHQPTSIKYTDNPVLNKILNETRGGIEREYISQTGGVEEYRTLNDKIYTTQDVNSLSPQLNNVADEDTKLKIGAVQSVKSRGLTVDQVPKGVLYNLTRNYRDVLSKSIEISKRKKGIV